MTVPVVFGRVIVRSSVGSVTMIVVSLSSSVDPSRTNGDAPLNTAIESACIPVRPDALPTKTPAVTVSDAVRFRMIPISLFLSTTNALSSATIPAVTPSNTLSSDAVMVAVPSSNERVPLA